MDEQRTAETDLRDYGPDDPYRRTRPPRGHYQCAEELMSMDETTDGPEQQELAE